MHWILDLFLLALLIYFMVDQRTLLWVSRCYELFYHLMVLTKGQLILIDIDDFRKFNNRFGHRVGNEALRKIGKILLIESHFRAFRYGGDELAVLLPWTSRKKAVMLAERIRQRVERMTVHGLKVTITCAVAHYEQTADELLLEVKKNTDKNIVISAGEAKYLMASNV